MVSRGNQRQRVFKDDPYQYRFQTLLSETVKGHSLTLYAYVLMANHFHLLLEVSRAPLSKAMQSLLDRYTSYYNRRYRKIGHLFQGRYKAILCDRDSYLMELIRYLHLNPVRAGMVKEPKQQRREMILSVGGAVVAASLIPIGYAEGGVTGVATAILVAEIAVWAGSAWIAHNILRVSVIGHLRMLMRPFITVALAVAVLPLSPFN